MKLAIRLSLTALLFVGVASSAQSPDAAAAPKPTPKPDEALSINSESKVTTGSPEAAPDLATIKKELEGLSPEERKAKLDEYRAKFGAKNTAPNRGPQQVSAEEWKAFTPDQRARYLQSWKATQQSNALTPEQRQEQLKIMESKLDAQIRNLQIRQKVGTITEREAEMLKRLESQKKRMASQKIPAPEYRGRTTAVPSSGSK